MRRAAIAPAIRKPTQTAMLKSRKIRARRSKGMWGWSLDFWDNVAFWTLVVGSVLAGIALAMTAVSSFVSLRASAIVQAEADQKIAEARRAAQLSEERSRKAEEGTALALERAAALEKDAANSRLEYERLRASLAWRRLSAEQRQRLVSFIRQSGLTVHKVNVITGDPESATFGNDLAQALAEAGKPPELIPNLYLNSQPVVGVIVNGQQTEITKLGEFLLNLGIKASGQISQQPLELIVGSKPPS